MFVAKALQQTSSARLLLGIKMGLSRAALFENPMPREGLSLKAWIIIAFVVNNELTWLV